MKKKLLSILVVMGMSIMALTGCGTTEDEKEETTTAAGVEQDVQNEQDTQGEQKEEVEQKDTVIASSVAVVQILDALGVEMAGVPTSSYELPESVENATRIGNPMEPDMEVIASLEPTVIVSVDTLSADLDEQFKAIGAESFFVNLSSYDGLKSSITELGERFGKKEKAEEIISGFEAKEAEIAELIKDKEGPSVLVIFGASGNFMVASEDTYVGDLVKRVGGKNIITDAPAAFSPVDMEYLASQNPEYILFMAHANLEESLEAFKQEMETNAAWQNFDAYKNDKVIALETGYFGMSANLQAVDAMEKLVDILYGEK
ncbi:MAG: heme ABC transporter substrate-binding protein IsdE [Lachnospiraceae bacterium]|nr:heme ABC transporter substrate-binding protein IsdE [Lachnospiraceae bacterium]